MTYKYFQLLLDAGCSVTDEHHEIDVANVLKTFLRELPEPLIPYSFHDLFLRCTLLGDRKSEAILLACLLLPTEHLNTLAYLMQVNITCDIFLKYVFFIESSKSPRYQIKRIEDIKISVTSRGKQVNSLILLLKQL